VAQKPLSNSRVTPWREDATTVLTTIIKRYLKAVVFMRVKMMAERVGFEPTIPVKVCPLSRRPVTPM
jgi:hypothetical protein